MDIQSESMNTGKFPIKILILLSIFFTVACMHQTDLKSDADIALLEQIDRVSPTGDYHHYVLPNEDDYANIPQDPKNAVTGAKKALGQYLFHETGIALLPNKPEGMLTYSCASCHIASAGFKPGRFQGIADGGVGFGYLGDTRELSPYYDETEIDAQGIRPLSVLNVAYVTNTTWSGQFGSFAINEGTEDVWDNFEETKVNHLGLSGIEAQNIEGLDLHRMLVNRDIVENLGYKSLFDLAFPEYDEDERYSNLTASFAISAYIRTLITNKAPFQEYLKGDYQALTAEEVNGAMLFFGDAGCYRCHSNPALGSSTFHAIGVNDLHALGALNTSADDKKNLGRGGFTGKEEDLYKFKVPQLYNLEGTPHYFHGSSKKSIKDVVEYFNNAIPENEIVPESQISDFFTPLYLSEQEVEDLTAFLTHALNDPFVERYQPPYLLSENCFPNNDEQSNIDTNCE